MLSPLSLNTTWATFFNQLNTRVHPGQASTSNVLTQQRVMMNAPAPSAGGDLSALPTGDGVDRAEAVTLSIRRQFSGSLRAADGQPDSTLLEWGVYSVNKRNPLRWYVELEPGEEITRTYTYDVLVYH